MKYIVSFTESNFHGTPVHIRREKDHPQAKPYKALTFGEFYRYWCHRKGVNLHGHQFYLNSVDGIAIDSLIAKIISGKPVEADLEISEFDMIRLGFAEFESGEYQGACVIHFRENCWIETVDGVLCYQDVDYDYLIVDLCNLGLIAGLRGC